MPKLPVQTNPEVAPQPINLPGPRQTTAGQGLQRFGQAIEQRGQQLAAVEQRAQQEADDAEEDRRVLLLRKELVGLRLRPRQEGSADLPGYRDWYQDLPTGRTRLGLAETYNAEARGLADKFAEGLRPDQQDRYRRKTEQVLLGWDAEVQQAEATALDTERTEELAAEQELLTTEIATKANQLTADSLIAKGEGGEGVDMRAAVHAQFEDASAVEAAARKMALHKKLGPEATDRYVRESVSLHHARVMQEMLNNPQVPKEFVRQHFESLAKQATPGPDGKPRAVLLPESQAVRQVQAEVYGQSRKARADALAAKALTDAKGDRLAAAAAIRNAAATTTDPEALSISAAAADGLQQQHKKVVEGVLLEEEPLRALFITQIRSQRLTSMDGLTTTVNGRAVGVKDLSIYSQEIIAKQLRSPRESRERRGTAPRGITSPEGQALWAWFGSLNEEQMQRYAEPNHVIYQSIPREEVPRFTEIVSKARQEITNGGAAMRKNAEALVVRAVAAKLKGRYNQASETEVVKGILNDVWFALPPNKVRTDQDVATAVRQTLSRWERVGPDDTEEVLTDAGIDLNAPRNYAASSYAGIRPRSTTKVYYDRTVNQWRPIENAEHEAALRTIPGILIEDPNALRR